ncbi:zinc ABC transporter substrate-binding protein [Tumebacillus sp. DT12]|uniref:Zinc ABC transporter substrate-binding protein n=1 Tax=Tumebacillus lacus TaxID=2995335 RepID=A0ABT3X2F3_9BACL|nr:zinc ABC transporter substrate-binding protein [Tumebacillus lacus]MCX7571079.1 zinc ABC transporter substrate-binding protein [Tumebacillus lacus]
MRWQKQIQKFAAVGLALTLALAGAGCTDAQKNTETNTKQVPSGEKVKVHTFLQAQADFAREIGQDKVEVQTMLPLGTNVWQFAPTLKETRDLESADVYVTSGGGVMEKRWADQLMAQLKLKNKDLVIVDPAKGIEMKPLLRYINPDDPEGAKQERQDPYDYLDPVHAKTEVDNILAGLSKKAPAYAEEFKKNADAYKQKLDALDQKYKDAISKAKRKELVSPYPAYQYLAARYGLKYYVPTYIALNDFPQDQPDKIAEVQKDLATHDVKTIFFEMEAAPRVQEFVGGLGYKSGILNTYEGRLDKEVGYKSYLQMMEENLQRLEQGLNE